MSGKNKRGGGFSSPVLCQVAVAIDISNKTNQQHPQIITF
jgi:hypothetical protein